MLLFGTIGNITVRKFWILLSSMSMSSSCPFIKASKVCRSLNFTAEQYTSVSLFTNDAPLNYECCMNDIIHTNLFSLLILSP